VGSIAPPRSNSVLDLGDLGDRLTVKLATQPWPNCGQHKAGLGKYLEAFFNEEGHHLTSPFRLAYTPPMPNGNHTITPSEWMRIRDFFHKLTEVLLDFAAMHNLKVDEYYHESPSWSFRFRHPKGGGASVDLERLDDLTIRITGSWYLDEYETFTRHLKWGPKHDYLLKIIDLRKELEATLREVLSWEKKELTPYPNYTNSWSKYSKDEWDRIFTTEHLPLLRP
jgi:hypothetical protein